MLPENFQSVEDSELHRRDIKAVCLLHEDGDRQLLCAADQVPGGFDEVKAFCHARSLNAQGMP